MATHKMTRPPVPGSPAIPGSGSGHGNGGAGGAKNPRVGPRYHPRRRLALVTHNIRTLRTDEKIVELEEELSGFHWDIMGLSEVRRIGEDTITLKSGNLLFYRGDDQQSRGGVGFLVHRSLINNIVSIESVSSRVVYLILRISKRYSLKVIQVYAPTSTHPDEEVEEMYEDISRAIHTSKTYFNVVMGDFNAKLGMRSDAELKVGKFGHGQRNLRCQRLADFLEKEGLFAMNSFFQKPPHRKWTWLSPDGSTRNEIDFILSTNRRMFSDISVINRVKTGSDHRMVRGSLNINVQLERRRLIKSTLRPTRVHVQNPESFQLELANRFDCLKENLAVDELNSGLVEAVHTEGSKYFRPRRRDRPQKLSIHTLDLMAERRSMALQSSDDAEAYRRLNRRIWKSLRHDVRAHNTVSIKETIERNGGSKVFARDLSIGQSQLSRLKTDGGRMVSTRAEVLREIERFYGQLYTSVAKPTASSAEDPRAELIRHFSDDIPDISLCEIEMALKQLKNNKAPGEDGITSELLKAGGTPILKVLQTLFNSVLLEGSTPEAWSRSVVVLFFKKGDNTLLKNYRPISLLSHIYKLFSRVITNRLEHRFDDFQPPEQAGFRKGFSTIDHIHTLGKSYKKPRSITCRFA
ncbi:hypothetical protein O3G_MSEX001433 [Manduca sexta]|uniref:Endonuclease/exonuclease/phosphatase domain-containing protein n=1 Tax=Manduca sexta TaxID=7130 RepID=A0A922CCM3_MANSE|nr:hypothetical protein O3G_MSEX001433 [Manduca sexta]